MQNFSTVARVKAEAGFSANHDISDATVQGYLDEASAIVQSFVAKKYDLNSVLSSPKFSGSQAEFLLKQCEELYAAGSLQNKEYAAQQSATTGSDGDPKLKRSLDLLNSMLQGMVIMLDTEGHEFPVSNTASNLRIAGFPQRSTDDALGTGRKFSMSDPITR